MGYEADCSLTIDGRRYRGVARLEHMDLVFRGETSLTIPLRDVAEVHARSESLFVTFGAKRAALAIGNGAAKWADRIGNPPSRVKKLGVKAGMRVALIGGPDPGLQQELEASGATIASAAETGLDAIFYGVRTTKDLARLKTLSGRLQPAGALWVIRGKGKGAVVSEADSMAAGKRAGLVDVKVVSFSDTHSAEKYVIPVARRARR